MVIDVLYVDGGEMKEWNFMWTTSRQKDLGGKATYENGQTLCAQHNFLKKNLKQTEMGKKLLIRLYELSQTKRDKKLMEFTTEILAVFEKNNIDDQIKW